MTLATGRPAHLPYPASDLLRVATAGSVDDGKSTLIGRLLHDSKSIHEDQLAAVEQATRRRGGSGLDLALLTDGLRAEREQGITIDVAYRYFSTPARTFIVADTPGHVQYTRNMVTGSSTADLAVVLVDARAGVVEQTRRHLVIASLLRVPRLTVAVNKMDLVDFDAGVFESIAADVRAFSAGLGVADVTIIPLSALCGDNVVERSAAMPWYEGLPLLAHLESVGRGQRTGAAPLRLPIQWVIRSPADPDYRAAAGRIEAGTIRVGDRVHVLPSDTETTVAGIDTYDGPLERAFAPLSVGVRLADDVDLGRGGMVADPTARPTPLRTVETIVCWLGGAPLAVGRRYRLIHTTRTVRAVASAIAGRLDINRLEREPATTLTTNEIGEATFALSEPIFADPYDACRETGSAILVDEATNETVGAVLVQAPRTADR